MDNIDTFVRKLQMAWSADTCYPPQRSDWTSSNPAIGQCAVSAILLQEKFGGVIAFCKHLDHFWNILPDGNEIDATESQFTPGELSQKTVDECFRSVVDLLEGPGAMNAQTKKRLFLLRSQIKQ